MFKRLRRFLTNRKNMVLFTYDRQNKVWLVRLKYDYINKGKTVAVLKNREIDWVNLKYRNNDIINQAIQTFQKI